MNANGLRQRSVSSSETKQRNVSAMPGLSIAALESASPQNTGYVMKLSIPMFYSILPRFIQCRLKSLITRFPFLSAILPMLPRWKHRYIILVGSFLYKYSEGKDEPKGSPLRLQPLEFTILSQNELESLLDDNLMDLPENHSSILSVESARKKYYFACKDRDEAQTWLNSLRQAQQETISRSLGHAPVDSYPSKWNYLDKLGNQLLKRNTDINVRMEKSKMCEMELVGLSGGPIPRGFYG